MHLLQFQLALSFGGGGGEEGGVPFPCRTRFFRLALSKNLSVLNELVILKNVDQTSFFVQVALKTSVFTGSKSVPSCLRAELKIKMNKRRSSSLFSIALDSYSDSPNFFPVFKSLLVLH